MPLPWLAVGQLVLGNLDKIIGLVKPAFTRGKVEVAPARADLIDQQIAELQTAAASNAEQIAALATQVKQVVAALEQAGVAAAAERAATRRLALSAGIVAVIALFIALAAVFLK
jgi:predicted HAD superfamily Cof-like phosphohydrolase